MRTINPISKLDLEDKIIWHFSYCGKYLVSSGYKNTLKLKRIRLNQGKLSTSEAEKKVWNKVRALPTHDKIKYFIWKCINGILPLVIFLS